MSHESKLIAISPSLGTFFSEQVTEVARKQGLKIEAPVVNYLGSLLERFSKTQNFLTTNPEGKKEFRRLTLIWAESATATPNDKYFLLTQLGDIALFTSGFFAERIPKSAVDLDFYMAMGEQAYEQAGQIRESIQSERALNVFFELSKSFPNFTEVLAEISEQSLLVNEKDLLKLYEKWLKNGSARISRMLNEVGIITAKGPLGQKD